jgi:ADP-ribose pyrophosphatase YjhB (NUDIX family)
MQQIIPQGDHKSRAVCPACDFIDYQNPRIISCAVVQYTGNDTEHKGKLLLCKRDIEPKRGLWTIPGGFLENNESVAAGAVRETQEEALADIDIKQLIAIVNLPDYDQVHMFYHATMDKAEFGITSESSEVELVAIDDIPWPQIAFRTVNAALRHYIEYKDNAQIPLLETEILFNQTPFKT